MKRLTLETGSIEVEKPTGGGRGPYALYTVDVLIDGRPALALRRDNFKEPGQMEAFVEILNALGGGR